MKCGDCDYWRQGAEPDADIGTCKFSLQAMYASTICGGGIDSERVARLKEQLEEINTGYCSVENFQRLDDRLRRWTRGVDSRLDTIEKRLDDIEDGEVLQSICERGRSANERIAERVSTRTRTGSSGFARGSDTLEITPTQSPTHYCLDCKRAVRPVKLRIMTIPPIYTCSLCGGTNTHPLTEAK